MTTCAAVDDQLLKVVSQLVFNLAASSSACLACIWNSCFPRQLTKAVNLGQGNTSWKTPAPSGLQLPCMNKSQPWQALTVHSQHRAAEQPACLRVWRESKCMIAVPQQ